MKEHLFQGIRRARAVTTALQVGGAAANQIEGAAVSQIDGAAATWLKTTPLGSNGAGSPVREREESGALGQGAGEIVSC